MGYNRSRLAVGRWWCVRCTRCQWGNTRKGTHEDCSRHPCPRCGAPVTLTPALTGEGRA